MVLFALPEETMNKILAYLSARPWNESNELIQAVNLKLKRVQVPDPEPVATATPTTDSAPANSPVDKVAPPTNLKKEAPARKDA